MQIFYSHALAAFLDIYYINITRMKKKNALIFCHCYSQKPLTSIAIQKYWQVQYQDIIVCDLWYCCNCQLYLLFETLCKEFFFLLLYFFFFYFFLFIFYIRCDHIFLYITVCILFRWPNIWPSLNMDFYLELYFHLLQKVDSSKKMTNFFCHVCSTECRDVEVKSVVNNLMPEWLLLDYWSKKFNTLF